VPEISRFYGIVIEMRFREHGTPHFHARCGGYEISVDISDGTTRGDFPQAKLKLVRQWLALHQNELMLNWDLAAQHLAPRYIDPLC
jgi:Domain of unknown function (DUF4160)